MIAIADTGPLNYLVLVGAVEILPALFGRVAIPPAVLTELQRARAPQVVRNWVSDPPFWLEVAPIQRLDATHLDHLGAGEREAILLAEDMRADWVIMDDRQGRLEAVRRHLRVIGTLRVLDEAAHKSLIDLPAIVTRLDQTTFHISSDLKEWLLTRHSHRKRDQAQ